MKKLHLVPQVVLDIGEGALHTKKNQFVRDNFAVRLEAIVEYCQAVLKVIEKETK